MEELIDDPFYEMRRTDYPYLGLTYVLVSDDDVGPGKESHKRAVIAALEALNRRCGGGQDHPYWVKEKKMRCKPCTIEELVRIHDVGWQDLGENEVRSLPIPKEMSYWYAFSEPPYPLPYKEEDFERINEMLFPSQNRGNMEVYRWNDSFSNYYPLNFYSF